MAKRIRQESLEMIQMKQTAFNLISRQPKDSAPVSTKKICSASSRASGSSVPKIRDLRTPDDPQFPHSCVGCVVLLQIKQRLTGSFIWELSSRRFLPCDETSL